VEPVPWSLAHGRVLELGPKARIMGVLNVTPDSFSDGGRFATVDAALRQADVMIAQGADIIDVGGESTKPGADVVDAGEEQRRILPVIEALAVRPAKRRLLKPSLRARISSTMSGACSASRASRVWPQIPVPVW